MERKERSAAPALAAISLACALLGGCVAPNNAYLMELNRSGKWREAERIGLDMLAQRGRFTASQTRETYFNVIYAKTRMGEKDEAARLMREYDALSESPAPDPRLPWIGREMAKLKDELGLLDAAGRELVAAMEENGRGNYARARELCDLALASGGANDAQKATAHFVAATCSVRLKDLQAAEAHFAAFERLKSALPQGSQALAEEAALRGGVEELRARSISDIRLK